MKFHATTSEITGVRNAIASVRSALAAVTSGDAQATQDQRDFEAWHQAAGQRSLSFSPRNPASADLFARDQATAELWSRYLNGAPLRRENLRHAVTLATRDLSDALWKVQDWFEQKLFPPETLTVDGAESLCQTAESFLSRRLPAHEPVADVAGPVDRDWIVRTYQTLLRFATPAT